ncbi:T2 family ribonuclease [Aspergillus clavatus NRRL 1]|uniref:ribonuclease T2 n=1 Tax=Aspergillus clavatus (strain ATCC 1007 / CBS 513.65 / DSM 816 / NCTC 3887 / NRRL 1 / QM 1276 / 107) TaxID=344612 RepID=A1CNG9_ASPCL|nr:ribonuclease T2, putative [Aspergillus clavatus NRRL 1]EAW07190.1 ribonuclease T2, putative [Aspergillus clavatus NRRL 1]
MSAYIPSVGMLALGAMHLASGVLGDLQTCPSDTPLSCSTSDSTAASCCFSSPGGTLLLTQFWDTDPATGPSDSWTLHGLWPDNCDGTYEQFCDTSREYSNITDILQAQGRTALLSDMNTYWKDYKGNDETFWEHEWNKHGTCVNTIEPTCYTDYTPQQEVGDFFQKAMDLFKTLDTYKALADAGITPSSSTTYRRSDILSALSAITGHEPSISCASGALNQAWYFFNIKGNAIDGQYTATDPLSSSNCPSSGIKYLPKPDN